MRQPHRPLTTIATVIVVQLMVREASCYTPVSPQFKNICVLSTEKIDAFIDCGEEIVTADDMQEVVKHFHDMVNVSVNFPVNRQDMT